MQLGVEVGEEGSGDGNREKGGDVDGAAEGETLDSEGGGAALDGGQQGVGTLGGRIGDVRGCTDSLVGDGSDGCGEMDGAG